MKEPWLRYLKKIFYNSVAELRGTIIQNEQDTQQFPLGGVGEIESGVSLLDTDGDGMPDEFEDGYGLDKNNPDDASQMAENGYTNIENYIFTLDERLDK